MTFYTSEIANDPKIVKLGFEALFKLAKETNSTVVHLVCASKGNLDGLVEQVLGPSLVKALRRSGEASISGTRILFHHERSIPISANGSPVLVCYPDEKLLQKTDAIRHVPALIVLPWSLEQIRPWLLARGAKDLLNKTDVAPSTIRNPVVEQALKAMIASINTSTGILHPSDKDTAIGTFKTLSDAKEAYDPEEVGAWFVQHGVDSRHTPSIVAVAGNPRGFRSTAIMRDWNRALELWRERAA